jgi:quinol monooxygenase YgiN
MAGTIRVSANNWRITMITLLNILTVDPTNQAQLLEMLRGNIESVIRTLDGWIATKLIASADGERVVIHSQWWDATAVAAMRSDPRMVAYFTKIAALASFDSIIGEITYAAEA